MGKNDREMGETDERRYLSIFLTPIHEGPAFSHFNNLLRSVSRPRPPPLETVIFQCWHMSFATSHRWTFTQGIQQFIIVSHHAHLSITVFPSLYIILVTSFAFFPYCIIHLGSSWIYHGNEYNCCYCACANMYIVIFFFE